MRPARLDTHTAERLLSGSVSPDDAPPGYAEVARVLHHAQSLDASVAALSEHAAVTAMSDALAGRLLPAPTEKRGSSMTSKVLSFKAAAAASAVLLSAGTAAAATGSLPGSAQTTASHVLRDIGISVPASDDHHESHATTRGESADHTTAARSTAANGSTADDDAEGAAETGSSDPDEGKGPNRAATFGLCTASAANDGHPNVHADVFPSAATCASTTHPGESEGTEDGTGGGAATSSNSPSNDTSNDGTSGNGTSGNGAPGNGGNDHPMGPPAGTPGAQPSSPPGLDGMQTPTEGSPAAGAPRGDPSGSGSGSHQQSGGGAGRGVPGS